MAGFGAPLVWQLKRAVFPSVTVWSDGGKVNVGATPETRGENMRGKKKRKKRNGFWEKILRKSKSEAEW